MAKKRRRTRRKGSVSAPPAPPVTGPLPVARDVPVLLAALSQLTALRIRAMHAHQDERAMMLLALAKGLAASSNTAALVALRPEVAQREAIHNAEEALLTDFEEMIEQVIQGLLKSNEAEVRPLLEQTRSTLQAARPSTPEGGEAIAAELKRLDQLLGAGSSVPGKKAVAARAVAAKAKR